MFESSKVSRVSTVGNLVGELLLKLVELLT
jgi:hypothetical protein